MEIVFESQFSGYSTKPGASLQENIDSILTDISDQDLFAEIKEDDSLDLEAEIFSPAKEQKPTAVSSITFEERLNAEINPKKYKKQIKARKHSKISTAVKTSPQLVQKPVEKLSLMFYYLFKPFEL